MGPPAAAPVSTATCWPSTFARAPAVSRATVSDGPPAWNGDTIVMKRLGKSWASAAGATRSATARQGIGLIMWASRFRVATDWTAACLCPLLHHHHHHQHDTERLLAPARREGGAPRPLDGLSHRIGIAPARLGHVLDRLQGDVVGDLGEFLAVLVGLRDADQLDFRIGRQHPLVVPAGA